VSVRSTLLPPARATRTRRSALIRAHPSSSLEIAPRMPLSLFTPIGSLLPPHRLRVAFGAASAGHGSEIRSRGRA
jgi:hypothetical protein